MGSKIVGGTVTKVLGFKAGTKQHVAAGMYLKTRGATNAEIKRKLGGPQLNLLKKVAGMGHEIERTTRNVKGKNVKVYRILLK